MISLSFKVVDDLFLFRGSYQLSILQQTFSFRICRTSVLLRILLVWQLPNSWCEFDVFCKIRNCVYIGGKWANFSFVKWFVSFHAFFKFSHIGKFGSSGKKSREFGSVCKIWRIWFIWQNSVSLFHSAIFEKSHWNQPKKNMPILSP